MRQIDNKFVRLGGFCGLLKAEPLLADRGYNGNWFRNTWKDKVIQPRIPSQKSRGKPVKHEKRRYKHRNRKRSCSPG